MRRPLAALGAGAILLSPTAANAAVLSDAAESPITITSPDQTLNAESAEKGEVENLRVEGRLTAVGRISVQVADDSGAVRDLGSWNAWPGGWSTYWNGRDDDGKQLPEGDYSITARLVGEGVDQTARMQAAIDNRLPATITSPDISTGELPAGDAAGRAEEPGLPLGDSLGGDDLV